MVVASRPDCRACLHRRDVPGDMHSACHHPATRALHADPMMGLLGVMGARSGGGLLGLTISGEVAYALGVRGSPHGIARGWFFWPVNFDPVWLEACDGFTVSPEKAAKDSPCE